MEIANVWTFGSMPGSYMRISRILKESNCQMFTICLFFIAQ
jgi:hypothetical protein